MVNGPNLTNEILQALVAADDERKAAALRILRGEPVAPPAPPAEPLLTLTALGRTLNIHPATLWRWQVPSRRFGGRPRYRLSEVERYFDTPAFRARAEELRLARQQYRESRRAAR